MESFSGPSHSKTKPDRRDTVSTVDSEKYVPIPPGFWSLTLHGNCARCNHHHRSAIIHIKISEDPSDTSHLMCEHCQQRWLTIGGLNATQLSLLSTRTTELDAEEVNFRHALINMVRSATSVATPTALASVPEATSYRPSRDHSHRPTSYDGFGETYKLNKDINICHRVNEGICSTNPSPGHSVDKCTGLRASTVSGHSVTTPKHFFVGLKRKLKDTLPKLKKFRIQSFIKPTKTGPLGDNSTNEHPSNQSQGTKTAGNASCNQSNDKRETQPAKRTVLEHAVGSSHQLLEKLKLVDKETLKRMTPYERSVWVRDQITDFECQRVRHHRSSHSFSMVDSSTQVYLLPSTSRGMPRRHSLEGLGSHFEHFSAGALFSPAGSFTISATRTSEADTAIDADPATYSQRSSTLEVAQFPQHRSWSPHPSILSMPRNSWRPLQRELTRHSVDSVLTGAPSNGWANTRGIDRGSIGSLTHMGLGSGRSTVQGGSDRASQEIDYGSVDHNMQDAAPGSASTSG